MELNNTEREKNLLEIYNKEENKNKIPICVLENEVIKKRFYLLMQDINTVNNLIMQIRKNYLKIQKDTVIFINHNNKIIQNNILLKELYEKFKSDNKILYLSVSKSEYFGGLIIN